MPRSVVDTRLVLALALSLGVLAFTRTWGGTSEEATDAGPPFALLFDGGHLPTFELTLPETSYRGLASEPFSYQPARFTYRHPYDHRSTIVLPAVGVRLKGLASFQPIDAKPALKIRFDRYVRRQRFVGLRSLTLNNMTQDPSMVRERLAYHAYRAAGLAAPRCNSARVFVNGTYYGVYANVQSIDQVFLESHFEPPLGSLYDLSRETYGVDLEPRWRSLFVLDSRGPGSRPQRLDDLIAAMAEPREDFVEAAERVVDLDQWLAAGGVQAMNADWDSYFFGAPNNYKLYRDPGCDCFVLLPWGADQTFGILNGRLRYVRYPITGPPPHHRQGVLFRRCRSSPDCMDRYLEHVERTLVLWEGLDLTAELDRILDQIRPAVAEEVGRGMPYQDFERAVRDLRRFLVRRGPIVREQLARARAAHVSGRADGD